MNGYHNIFLSWTVTIAYTYNERLQQHLLIMNGYHNIFLQWVGGYHNIYLHWTYNIYILITMNGYHNIYLQWEVTTPTTYNERLP